MSCYDYLQVVVHQNATFTGQLAERVRYGHFPPSTHLPSSFHSISLFLSFLPSFPHSHLPSLAQSLLLPQECVYWGGMEPLSLHDGRVSTVRSELIATF